MRVPVNRGPTC
nr:unnamed protein product [Callosobruchus chinensis]